MIVEKRRNIVDGIGYMCSKEKVTIATHTSWLNSKISTRDIRTEKMDSDDCWAMLISKKCHGQTMIGIDDYYKSIEEPKAEWSYFSIGIKNYVSYHCHLFKRILISNDLNAPMFQHSQSRCWPEDLYCQLTDQVVIWKPDIIHSCPFFQIRTIELNVTDQIAYGEQFVFQIINQLHQCEMEFLVTSEGLYLTNDIKASKLETSTLDLSMSTHFLLAEMDASTTSILKIIHKQITLLNNQICRLFQQHVSNLQNMEYMELVGLTEKDIVVFNDYSEIVLTECFEVTSIKLILEPKYCYKHIPVQFIINNITIFGFLRNNYLLTLESTVVSCSDTNAVFLPKTNEIIIFNNQSIRIKQSSRKVLDIHYINPHWKDIKFLHAKELIEPINIVKQIQQLTRLEDHDGTFMVLSQLTIPKTEAEIRKNINSTFISHIIHRVLLYSIFTIGSIILLFVVIRKCKKRYQKPKLVQTNMTINNQNESPTETVQIPEEGHSLIEPSPAVETQPSTSNDGNQNVPVTVVMNQDIIETPLVIDVKEISESVNRFNQKLDKFKSHT
jgi:hypothetical protein